ncbi:MAG TPA: hypothetical protein DEG17_01420 [Cyanobacteria bacterium UBA11149]|nr:hypothetical protein [Cyanobacteria bacterium UBA11367]HBE56825.1 hypothetical protein [Cyanobacteria bacterium UBA11366]HBK63328.1 hypothetical protein [Cyanobacteria bacterium UBA11166]HBR72157.1 hypothetical protein [Cyanobacteria bacterium UBA11159]HBS71023.1 hypothetical protein [Cyanobacteria bacterium UBA11153]HBW87570.1 hypothetical protein [Cyanobacteria bacterium UBA11149]
MVNFGLNSASILGIFLAVAGAGLYLLRSVRPELARDHDIFFAAVGLLCGFILIFQGWRLDPILQFGQLLLTGATIFFAYEAIRLRGIATDQAKRGTRIVDDDRAVSNAYRYEEEDEFYDKIEPEVDRYANRRLRGSEDSRYSRGDRYEAESRRPRSRGSSERERGPSDERPRKRRTRPESSTSERPVERWEADLDSDWNDKPSRSTSTRPSRPPTRESDVSSKPRRRRSPEDSSPSRSSYDKDVDATPSDYVDYQPIDSPEGDSEKSDNFDY